jgi:predicted DNA-binding mobile mystery protein A
MSSSELASRMGVGQSTISGLEHGEVLGTIKLGTLKRAAAALECDLVYYLAPRGSLEDVAQAQARRKAREQLADDSSYRDDSIVGDSSRIDELASNYLDHKGLWTD